MHKMPRKHESQGILLENAKSLRDDYRCGKSIHTFSIYLNNNLENNSVRVISLCISTAFALKYNWERPNFRKSSFEDTGNNIIRHILRRSSEGETFALCHNNGISHLLEIIQAS